MALPVVTFRQLSLGLVLVVSMSVAIIHLRKAILLLRGQAGRTGSTFYTTVVVAARRNIASSFSHSHIGLTCSLLAAASNSVDRNVRLFV